MEQATTPVAGSLGEPDLFPFTVTDTMEITSVLVGLCKHRIRASVYFNAQPGSILTCLLAVQASTRTLVFDVDRDERRNVALVSAEKLAWRTAVDGVKIEFSTGQARLIDFDGGPALEAPLPSRMLRLQRRNAFRAPVPVSRPPICLVDVDGTGKVAFKARVLDISTLGLSLLIDSNAVQLTPLLQLARLSLELPGFGEVQCSAEIRYAIDPGRRHPASLRRCGVQFKNVAAADEVLLQRYVIALDRDRAKNRLTE